MLLDELKEKIKEELKQHYKHNLSFDYNGKCIQEKIFNEDACLEGIMEIINEFIIK